MNIRSASFGDVSLQITQQLHSPSASVAKILIRQHRLRENFHVFDTSHFSLSHLWMDRGKWEVRGRQSESWLVLMFLVCSMGTSHRKRNKKCGNMVEKGIHSPVETKGTDKDACCRGFTLIRIDFSFPIESHWITSSQQQQWEMQSCCSYISLSLSLSDFL